MGTVHPQSNPQSKPGRGDSCSPGPAAGTLTTETAPPLALPPARSPQVHLVRAPVLIVAGSVDYITPIQHVRKAAEIMGNRATLIERPYHHIELSQK